MLSDCSFVLYSPSILIKIEKNREIRSAEQSSADAFGVKLESAKFLADF